MTRESKAVVCREWGKPITVETIQVAAPRKNEITIKVAACGVCHSDLSATTGKIQYPPPLVLGHEASGIVIEVGEGVTAFKEGDHVVSSFISMCGKCRQCVRGRPVLCENARKAMFTLPDGTVRTQDKDGNDLNVFGACGVMAEYATLHVDNAVKIDPATPLPQAALVSCAVVTGVGAVFNTAKVEPGSRTAVFGVGGVGLNAIQGCHTAGAEMIVAVDTSDSKLQMAKEFGATHTVNINDVEDAAKAVKKLTEGGVDYAFECVGAGAVVAQAYKCLARGGTTVVVGVADPKDKTQFGTLSMPADERTIKGSWLGSARPQYDFPRILGLYNMGKLKLDELITKTYSIDEAPQAFDDMEAGKNARGVIVFE
ncbi:Zn-dependent alcohol dehydrogenase [Marinobacter sp. BGYM27]|uniref:Zn-dependent alcohol dehydrogenase n=1 Tax=Marinobacter sp. BGYM27 TaxID=2975597 RepID=UPI0021A8270E|nr:Zn-dependent alcohol dehydrogenase [Marinobacter sp. BGYM27]MDG5499993.1 Zn-dependent alcohol dehydrogenase [Marinobacter sp. BGYM27]